MSFFGYKIKDIEEKLHKMEMSESDVVDLSFKRINEIDDQIGAFLTLDEENARAQAKTLDDSTNHEGKLFAIPAGIKDNIVTKGLRTTCASQFLSNFNEPLYNAFAIEKLNEIGRASCRERR